MRYVAAYLLAVLGGNESPSERDLKKILESVGVGYDAERASLIVSQLKGKSIDQVSFHQFKLKSFYAFSGQCSYFMHPGNTRKAFYTPRTKKGFLLFSGDMKLEH